MNHHTLSPRCLHLAALNTHLEQLETLHWKSQPRTHGTHLDSAVMCSRQGSECSGVGASLSASVMVRVQSPGKRIIRNKVSGIASEASGLFDLAGNCDEVHHDSRLDFSSKQTNTSVLTGSSHFIAFYYKTPSNTSYCLFSFHCLSTYYSLCTVGPLKES